MSNKKDFATSTVLTAPSTPTAGTSLVVQSGHGARFPAAPFYVVAHPPTEFPTLDNAEKLLVSAKSTDTFTITRAQGDTSAKSIEAGWRISNSLFLGDIPADFDDLVDGSTNVAFTTTLKSKLDGVEASADVTDATNVDAAGATMNTDTNVKSNSWVLDQDNMSGNDDTKVPTQQSVKAYVDAAIAATRIPVGGLYFSTNSTNPNTSLGYGTWSAFGAGRVPVGFDSGDGDFDTDEETGGSKTRSLVLANMVAHTHTINLYHNGASDGATRVSNEATSGSGVGLDGNASITGFGDGGGTSSAFSIMNPYVVVRMWKRTA